MEDNKGAVVRATERIRYAKHISIRRNFVKEQTENGTIDLTYCQTDKMNADILTKPLLSVSFCRHREGMNIRRFSHLRND